MIHSRDQFPEIWKQRGYGVGAEIGVLDGDFSFFVTTSWNGTLWLVDKWTHTDGVRDVNNHNDADFETMYRGVVERFGGNPNVRILRKDSVEAAGDFPDESLDWVFLDAGHTYKQVVKDLKAWFPKVRKGGMFSGHDYFDSVDNYYAEFGVKSAVDEFFASLGMAFETTDCDPHSISWYVFK